MAVSNSIRHSLGTHHLRTGKQISYLKTLTTSSSLPNPILKIHVFWNRTPDAALLPWALSPVDPPLLTSLLQLFNLSHSLLQQTPPSNPRAIPPRATSSLKPQPHFFYCCWDPVLQFNPHFYCRKTTTISLSSLTPTPKTIKTSSNLPFSKSSQYPSFQHQQAFPVNIPAEQARKRRNTQPSHSTKLQRGNINQIIKYPPNKDKWWDQNLDL